MSDTGVPRGGGGGGGAAVGGSGRSARARANTHASPSSGASGSPQDEDQGAGGKKRLRVSRACDTCYAKKDKCDGALPVCRVCRELDRRCTYDRPERKRGPLQGVRQRLEGQIEILESMLGFLVYTFPPLQTEVVRNLRLDDGETFMRSQQSSSQAAGPSRLPSGEIYPHFSKQQARSVWRASNLAKSVAPSLGLALGSGGAGAGVDEDDLRALSDPGQHRLRVEEARRARLFLLGQKPASINHPSDLSGTGSSTGDAALSAAATAAAYMQHQQGGPTGMQHYPIPVHPSQDFSSAGHHHSSSPVQMPLMPPPPPSSILSSAHFPSHPTPIHPLMHTHFGGAKPVPGSPATNEHSVLPTASDGSFGGGSHHDIWSHQPFDLADLGEDAHALAYALGLPAGDVGPTHGSGGGNQYQRHVPSGFLLHSAPSPGGFYAGASFSSPSPSNSDRHGGRGTAHPQSDPTLASAASHDEREVRSTANVFDTPKPFDDDLDALANLAGVHVPPGQASTILFQLGLQDPLSGGSADVVAGFSADIDLNSPRRSAEAAASGAHDSLRTRSHWPPRMSVQ